MSITIPAAASAVPNRGAEPSVLASEVAEFLTSMRDHIADINLMIADLDAASGNVVTRDLYIYGSRTYLGDWSGATTYNSSESVTYASRLYISKVGGNLNNTPAGVTDANWLLVDILSSASVSAQSIASASGTIQLDVGTYNLFTIECVGDITIEFTGVNSAEWRSPEIIFSNGYNYTITMPAATKNLGQFNGGTDYMDTRYYESVPKSDFSITDFRSAIYSNDGNICYLLIDSDNAKDENVIYRYDLSIPNEIKTAIWSGQSYDLSATHSKLRLAGINSEGTKILAVEDTLDVIIQIDMSTPNDLTTASVNASTLALDTGVVVDSCMTTDGTRLFTYTSTGLIQQYNFAIGFDITTGSYNQQLSVVGKVGFHKGITCNSDCSEIVFFGVGSATYEETYLYVYALSTAGDLSSWSQKNVYFALTGGATGEISMNTTSDFDRLVFFMSTHDVVRSMRIPSDNYLKLEQFNDTDFAVTLQTEV